MKCHALCGRHQCGGSGGDGVTQGDGDGSKACNDCHLEFALWRKGLTQ